MRTRLDAAVILLQTDDQTCSAARQQEVRHRSPWRQAFRETFTESPPAAACGSEDASLAKSRLGSVETLGETGIQPASHAHGERLTAHYLRGERCMDRRFPLYTADSLTILLMVRPPGRGRKDRDCS